MGIRVLLADDHEIVRQGLRGLLDEQADMEVVAEAKDGREALGLVREIQPDIVVMDVTMPNLNGIDATCQIVRQYPEVKVLALSAHSGRSYAASMLKAGARGYVLKECLFDELIRAMRTVAAGRIYLSTRIASDVATDYVKRLSDTTPPSPNTLTGGKMKGLQLPTKTRAVKQTPRRPQAGPDTAQVNRRTNASRIGISIVADRANRPCARRDSLSEGLSDEVGPKR